jgi:SAM-dependent methyltransferase
MQRLLKRVGRFLINTMTMHPLSGPFEHVADCCWSARLPKLAHLANGRHNGSRSTLVVYEGGRPLGPAHSHRDDIRLRGCGRFTHWEGQVFFSSSDNSDPNTNGRSYRFTLSPWLFRRRLGIDGSMHALPGNHQRRATSPEQLRRDVAYALQCGQYYLSEARQYLGSLTGRQVLEVGPGINYGSVMVLACYGMKPIVADRFLAPWEDAYHRRFYTQLADELARTNSSADVSALRALVEEGGYLDTVIRRVASPLEAIPLPADSIELVFSNAVVEHLSNLDKSFKQLYRITRRGGLGMHQVDFRDHRDFSRPLEYLLLEQEEFQKIFEGSHTECGNRYRPDEVLAWIEQAGFEVLSFHATERSTSTYLNAFLPRLHAATASRYRHLQARDLEVLGGCYRLRKAFC